jgi:hypothetical protein
LSCERLGIFARKELALRQTNTVLQDEGEQMPLRSDKRIHVALPVRVTYWDGKSKPCLEMACTYDISARGARITGLRCVKGTGEIIVIERGRNRAYCRVVWMGEPKSALHGQIGIQCVESERMMWEAELRDLEETYDPIQLDINNRTSSSFRVHSSRRRQPRFEIEGMAELLKQEAKPAEIRGQLRNLSEFGCLVTTKQVLLPGTDLKLVLNVANYDIRAKGQVRHAALDLGLGIEFNEIRKGDRQVLQFLLRRLAEKQHEAEFSLEVES